MYTLIKEEINFWKKYLDRMDLSESNPRHEDKLIEAAWVNGKLSAYNEMLLRIRKKETAPTVIKCGSYYKE